MGACTRSAPETSRCLATAASATTSTPPRPSAAAPCSARTSARHVIVNRDGREGARPRGRDAVIGGGLGDGLGEPGGKVLALRIAHDVLEPVEDQRLLAEVERAGAGERDGFAGQGVVAGDHGIEAPGKAALGPGGAAGDEGLELLPARRAALALALEQAEPLRAEEQAGVFGENRYRFVACLGETSQRKTPQYHDRRQFLHHCTDCVIATQS